MAIRCSARSAASRSTAATPTVINSYVSECKAIGQDSQAIGGFNGPGNYLIENNYLEGATENFLLGGSDPTIPNLVTTDITFRHNHLPQAAVVARSDRRDADGASAQPAGRRIARCRHLQLPRRRAR